MNNILTIFNSWKAQGTSVIQLLNKEQLPVAALYLNKLNLDQLAICETTNISEKYYIYINGVAVFFTYYKK